jgi:hypothetical protein
MQGLNRRFKNNAEVSCARRQFLSRSGKREPRRGRALSSLTWSLFTIPARVSVNLPHEIRKPPCAPGELRLIGCPGSQRARRPSSSEARLDYFLASQLAGCQIRIVPAPYRFGFTNHPRVLHIAGNVTSAADPHGTAWRNQQAQNALTPPPNG